MVNDLVNGISVKLNSTFGAGFAIYSDSIQQGLTEPCFFIKVLNPSQTPLLGNRKQRQNPFDVHYFPLVSGSNSEINTKAEALFDALAFIILLNGDLVHGTDMNYEVVDGVLHFFVNYNLIVKNVIPVEDFMETVTLDENLKG